MRRSWNDEKNFMMLWKKIAAMTLLYGAVGQPNAQPNAFPTRPIRIVLGIAPGGGTDIVSRAIGQKLTEQIGRAHV